MTGVRAGFLAGSRLGTSLPRRSSGHESSDPLWIRAEARLDRIVINHRAIRVFEAVPHLVPVRGRGCDGKQRMFMSEVRQLPVMQRGRFFQLVAVGLFVVILLSGWWTRSNG